MLKLLPHLHGTDGFFAAVFERKAALAEKKSTEKSQESAVRSEGVEPVIEEISARKVIKNSNKKKV